MFSPLPVIKLKRKMLMGGKENALQNYTPNYKELKETVKRTKKNHELHSQPWT
jgi:hypothetical protein